MRSISLGILLSAGIALAATAACTSGGDDGSKDGTGGGSASGGGNGSGGTGLGTGGNGTGGGGGEVGGDSDAIACDTVSSAELLDFALGMGGAGSAPKETFGDFTTTFSGGTFFYPSVTSDNNTEILTSDVSGGDWHLSGTLDTYGGFGLFTSKGSSGCTKFDASAYKGIQFDIKGDTGGKPITLNVGTAANTITSAWFQANGKPDAEPSFGRCTPKGTGSQAQYDGTCAEFGKSINVTAGGATVKVLWADLTGGAPETTVDPSELTSISWRFTPPEGVDAAGEVPYEVDVTLDNIGFIE